MTQEPDDPERAVGAIQTVLEQAVRRASVTRTVVVDPGALARLPQVLAALGPSRAWQLVADPNTMAAAGHGVVAALRTAGIEMAPTIVLDELPRVKPRAETARDVGARLASTRALPIAVGAGVINDVTKYAAHVAGVAYVCVATAASMDGYAASGAALLDDGFKRTLGCPPPVAIVADLDVIAGAPSRMAGWGYGDLSGKLVAGADWLLADAVGEDPIAQAPFALVQHHIKGWLSGFDGIASCDRRALRGLTDGLLISGFAMQAHGNSRPASGSEHQISHLWEMERLMVNGEPAAHGACVGVATVAMLALYEWFLEQDVVTAAGARDRADADPHRLDAELTAAFAERSLVESARIEVKAKLAGAARRSLRLRLLRAAWPVLRERLRATLVPASALAQWLAACGAAAHPVDLAVPLAKLAADYRRARLIRRRYTILDTLEDLGWLDKALAALFAGDGFWGSRTRASAPAAAGLEGVPGSLGVR
jgi:glycerol-1-phosphate dehydrogenase [NAD(P)+]